MIMVPDGAAHRAWVADYKTRGPALTQYAAYVRGFNEGAACALETYLLAVPVVPEVPTVEVVRELFCQQVQRRSIAARLARLKKMFGAS
jgi:hypothetical protein